jgi:hypothetical protein
MAPAIDAAHIGQPDTLNIATVKKAPPATATAPTMRRPWTSASLPPATTPIPPGVFVNNENSEIFNAEKPRTSLRYRLLKKDAGATSRLTRNAELARRANRRRWNVGATA